MWQVGLEKIFKRTKELGVKMFFRITLIVFASFVFVYGARPMVTDDADVVDTHSCQLETWGLYDGNYAEYWAVPGCNMFWNLEISMGAMMSNVAVEGTEERFRTHQFVAGAKKIFGDLESKGYSYGLVLGNAYNFLYSKYRNDHYGYLLFSTAFFEHTLLFHSNLGYRFKRHQDEPHIYHFGLGLEKQLSKRIWILGEGLYERTADMQFQVGLRIWLLQDKIQLDGTYGNAFKGGQSWVSMGLRFLSPELF